MKNALLNELKLDAEVLFRRALLGKTITCFGEDGFGKYGRNELPVSFQVEQISIELEDMDPSSFDLDTIQASLFIFLKGYSASSYGGTAATDQNALLSIQQLLKEHEIDTTAIEWAPVREQQEGALVLSVELEKLDLV